MKHPLSKSLCFTRNLARRKIWSLDRVECKRHIGVLIIDEGTEYALRQRVCFIAQLFASLVKLFRDVFWSSGVLETHLHQRESGPGEGLYAIVVAQFLQALLERLGNEVLHLLCRRSRPHRRNGKHLDGEGRVFCASQFQEGKDASSNDRNQQEQGDRLFVDRERRQVEKPLRRILANVGSRDAMFLEQLLVFFRHMMLAHWISALFSTRTR